MTLRNDIAAFLKGNMDYDGMTPAQRSIWWADLGSGKVADQIDEAVRRVVAEAYLQGFADGQRERTDGNP